MKFTNAKIFTGDAVFKTGSVTVENGKIASLDFDSANSSNDENAIDCKGNYLIPGLLDIHFHGCAGHDFCEANAEAISAIARYELKNGITSICPATMTYPESILQPVMQAAASWNDDSAANLVGINMEGPFISPDKVGAQNPEYVQKPNFDMILRLQDEANGLIKLIDIAPEVDGGIDFVKAASKDFHISIAHTCTDYNTAKQAYELGATHLTHTYNAMPGIHHRDPGPIVAASESGAFAELICDGMHVNYATVRLAFNMFGEDHLCLISDSCEATGLEDGEYSLGGQKIFKKNNIAVLAEHPDTIAASATNLFDCMKHAIFDAGIKTETAIKAASINPAKAIGVDDKYGSIVEGKVADFLLVDKDFNLLTVYKSGEEVE